MGLSRQKKETNIGLHYYCITQEKQDFLGFFTPLSDIKFFTTSSNPCNDLEEPKEPIRWADSRRLLAQTGVWRYRDPRHQLYNMNLWVRINRLHNLV
jgi:hypothetical protein